MIMLSVTYWLYYIDIVSVMILKNNFKYICTYRLDSLCIIYIIMYVLLLLSVLFLRTHLKDFLSECIAGFAIYNDSNSE